MFLFVQNTGRSSKEVVWHFGHQNKCCPSALGREKVDRAQSVTK